MSIAKLPSNVLIWMVQVLFLSLGEYNLYIVNTTRRFIYYRESVLHLRKHDVSCSLM